MKPAMTPQQEELTSSSKSSLTLYKELAVGRSSLFSFLKYEILTTLFSNTPGILGFGIRAILFPSLFRSCGRRPAIGRGVILRSPGNTTIGDKFLLDDYSVLDVRGETGSIVIGNFVSIGRFTTITAKQGSVTLGNGVNIGTYSRIATQSKVKIGDSALIAAYVYIGPGNHQMGDSETPLISRDMEIKGGVEIGAHAWIGAHSTIVDGVSVGEGSIIGAHSFVKDNVPPHTLVAGVPAKVIKVLK